MRKFFATIVILGEMTNGAWAMQGMQTDMERFGIGIASLATRECEGYRLGPGAERVFADLGAATEAERRELLRLAERDARQFLATQGKTICEVAEDMARQGRLLERF